MRFNPACNGNRGEQKEPTSRQQQQQQQHEMERCEIRKRERGNRQLYAALVVAGEVDLPGTPAFLPVQSALSTSSAGRSNAVVKVNNARAVCGVADHRFVRNPSSQQGATAQRG